jgi:membrane-associated phospholipid phosphatase
MVVLKNEHRRPTKTSTLQISTRQQRAISNTLMMKQQQQPDLDDFDDENNDRIEIVPLVVAGLTAARQSSFFQRSSTSSTSGSGNGTSVGMTSTPPTSLGGLPARQSSSSLERQAPESILGLFGAGISGHHCLPQRFLCWVICCCSSGGTVVSSVVPEEIMLLFQALGALCFALLGWYIPRGLIQQAAADIVHKKILNYQTTVAGDVILDALLNQPYIEPPTIPSHVLLTTSIWIPLAVVLLVSTTSAAWSGNCINNTAWTTTARSKHRPAILLTLLHHVQAAWGGFCTALGLSEGLTQLLKLYIQRKRPNFFALCNFDTSSKVCTAQPASRILEANFSCPSGHSSLAACGMTFLALHVVAKIISLSAPSTSLTSTSSSSILLCDSSSSIPTASCQCSRLTTMVAQRKQLSCLVVVVLTSSWAMFVGASRVVDQWHHPSDVVAGLILGSFCAVVAYHVWFPPVWLFMMMQLPLLPTSNYSHANANSTGSGSSTNGTWTSVAGIPWSLIAATNGAAAGASALAMVDGKLPSFHD